MNAKRILPFFLLLLSLCATQPLQAGKKVQKNFRLLYWNIQMGMWDGQSDNYERFVNWIVSKDPDVCVWTEAATLCATDSEEHLPKEQRYLPAGWPELARRYGHEYVFVGGMRDPFPQVITSKYPIDSLGAFVGSQPDSVVMHGAGWARLNVEGKKINILTVHLQPYAYWRFLPGEQKEESSRNFGGEKYRRMEMQWIFNHSIRTVEHPEKELWMLMGDFNACSRKDNFHYKWSQASQSFLTHNYIERQTPWLYDVVAEKFPETFCPSHSNKKRIDYIYVSQALLKSIKKVVLQPDAYSKPKSSAVNDKFKCPSDHLPIIVDFNLDKIK